MTRLIDTMRHPRAAWVGLGVLLALQTMGHVHFIQTTDLDLFPDEAQYWDWSRHPDWSYYSKGPLVAWAIGAGITVASLAGRPDDPPSPVAVRAPAVVSSVLATALMFLLGARIGRSAWAGLLAAVAFRLCPLYVAEGIVLTTDSLLVPCWIAALLAVEIAVASHRPEGWLFLGAILGIGFLAKYSMALFLPGLVAILFLSGGTRRTLTPRIAVVALVLALLGTVPVLIWNVQNDWASFRHVAGHVGKDVGTGPTLARRGATATEFLASQAGVVTPVLYAGLLAVLFAGIRRPGGGADDARSLAAGCWRMAWSALPMLAALHGASLLGRCEANWAAPAYTGLIASAAAMVVSIWPERRWWTVAALVLALPLTAVAYDFELLYALGLPKVPRWSPLTRMMGWSALGERVGEIRGEWNEGGPPFLFSDRYFVTSELAFYVPGNPRTYCIDLGRRRNQYDYWPEPDHHEGRDALFVTDRPLEQVPEPVVRSFERTELLAPVVYRRHGMEWRRFSIAACYGFKGELARSPAAGGRRTTKY